MSHSRFSASDPVRYLNCPNYLAQLTDAAVAEGRFIRWMLANGYTLVPGTHDMWEKKQ